MKVKINNLEEKKKFKPFDLVISIESEEEFKNLYALFNVPDSDLTNCIRRAVDKNFEKDINTVRIFYALDDEVDSQDLDF